MASLGLYWLGPPRIEVEGRLIRLETRKVTALLAVLSVDRRAHAREHLAALLWPEYDATRAPANLRRALASLQASLGPGRLTSDREALELVMTTDVSVDTEEVSSAIRRARAHHPDSEGELCPACARELERASELYRGDFLEGLNLKDCPDFDSWQTQKRDELSQATGWALERLADSSARAGRWAEAVDRARRWLALDPVHEAAHRTLMFLYARAGNPSAALRQFQECERLLRQELGQEPSKATRSLHARILERKLEPARDPGAAPPVSAAAAQAQKPDATLAQKPPPGAASTRLRPPPIRPALVERARLLALLDQGASRPVTLVSAPAGFGKTTLLAEWARGCGLPVAWLSLEEADSDPSRLAAGLASSLGRLDPRIGVEALQMLGSLQAAPLPSVVASILSDLGAYPDSRVLVLDDYHLVQRREAEDLVADFAQHLPEGLHLFIATRADPAMPLARMRARAQLAEVRADDLRFRPEEAAAFLHQVMGLALTEEDIALLEQRTEGWAAGLQMAALSLQRRQDPGAFIRSFGGSHRYIMDYLVGEVLEGQPADIQRFLLTTSVLDRFCSELCDQVTERTGSQETLEGLDRANLFLVPLDDERRWYRYHHLFADLLRHRLRQQRAAGEIDEMHLRAARWLEGSFDLEGAMRHYLAGRHYGEAIRLIVEKDTVILTRGGLGTLLGWIAQIPAEEIDRSAQGSATVGTTFGWAGRPADAERHFARVDALLADAPDTGEAGAIKGQAAVMRAFVADVAGDMGRAIELARRADTLLPRQASMARSLVPYILGRAYRYQGDLEKAAAYTREQIALAKAANNLWSLSGALHELVILCRIRGTLREADRALDEFEAIPREATANGPIAKVIADRAEIQREHGDLAAARSTMRTALEAVTRWGLPSDRYFCHLFGIRIGLSAGQLDLAEADLDAAEGLARTSLVYASMFPLLEAERVRVLLARGRLTEALAWLGSYQYPIESNPVNGEVVSMARARVLLAAGRSAEASEALRRLAESAEAGGRFGRLVEILALETLALSKITGHRISGRENATRECLGRALAIAQPEGYVRVFLDEGEPMLDSLRCLLDRPEGIPPQILEFAQRLTIS